MNRAAFFTFHDDNFQIISCCPSHKPRFNIILHALTLLLMYHLRVMNETTVNDKAIGIFFLSVGEKLNDYHENLCCHDSFSSLFLCCLIIPVTVIELFGILENDLQRILFYF